MNSETKQYKLWDTEVNLHLESVPSDDEMKQMNEDLGNPTRGYFQTPEGKLHYLEFIPSPFDSNSDGMNSSNGIKAVCVFQHGIQSCSDSVVKLVNPDDNSITYTKMGLLGRKFKAANIALYCPDMLGHGFSEGKRFYIPHGNGQINRDGLARFATFVGEKHGSVPFFICGESYGANLALQVAKMWQNSKDNDSKSKNVDKDEPSFTKPPRGFEGVCINAPAIVGDLPPAPLRFFLQYVLAPLIPESTPFFMPHPISPERIWRNEVVRKTQTSMEVKKRGLSAGAVPYRLGTALGLVNALHTVQKEVIPGFKIPFSVCHGTDDWGVKIEGSKLLVENCDTKEEDRAAFFVDGAYHDLFSDPCMNDVVDFHIKFIESRIEPL